MGNSGYIHHLLDVINNHTKFQLHWIRTLNFQLRLFDTTGQWKWYKWVKLIEYYYHASLTFVIFIVSKKIKILPQTASLFMITWVKNQPSVTTTELSHNKKTVTTPVLIQSQWPQQSNQVFSHCRRWGRQEVPQFHVLQQVVCTAWIYSSSPNQLGSELNFLRFS